MEALRLEFHRQLDRHLDLLEEAQREWELLALVDLEVGERERHGHLALHALDREGHGAVRDRVARRGLHQRDEDDELPLLVLGAHAQLLHAQHARPVLAHDEPAVELQLLLLARSLGLELAHHQLRVGLRLLVDLLAELGDGDAVAKRLVLRLQLPRALAEVEPFEHGAHHEVARARAPELEGAPGERRDADRDERDLPARHAGFLGQARTPLESPRERELARMHWIKAWHVVFMVTWFAGLFYLPRLFVYHAEATDSPGIGRFRDMERRLFAIMTLGGALTVAF